MAATLSSGSSHSLCRCAVVTGSNKGIGLEICRQLAAKGVTVVLTARDEKRGLEAVAELKASSDFSDELVVFHQLDVADPTSIASLADFIKTQFGKLDILVNNAGISGSIMDYDAFKTWSVDANRIKLEEIMKETYELVEECLKTNYYGAKKMIEAHTPLLELSDSPRIVNVSSSWGKLKNITNEWAKGVLSQTESLSEDKIDEVLNEFKKDFKAGSSRAKKWPLAYPLSKAAMNCYTRILAKKYPKFCINCVCPGYVKTDINLNTGTLTVEQGAEGPLKLALLTNGGPSGLFFSQTEESSFE